MNSRLAIPQIQERISWKASRHCQSATIVPKEKHEIYFFYIAIIL